MEPGPELLSLALQPGPEFLPVVIIPKDSLLLVPPCGDVIQGSFILDP
jgi:hypothetical protein